MRILFVSHTDSHGIFRVGSHHLSAELARLGHDVVHLSTPISMVHRVLGRVPRSRARATPSDEVDASGVRHIVPRTLLPAGIGTFSVATELRRRRLDRFDLVLVDQPLMWHQSVRELADIVVYRPTDEYPRGMKAGLQRDALHHVDGVIATSVEVLRGLGDVRVPAIVVPNGVDTARFTETNGTRAETCVYAGALDRRFDWGQVARWAGAHRDVRFELIGPLTGEPPTLPDNVAVLGALPYDELPARFAAARVGLLPLSDDPGNAGRSPMKLYEYLASGLNVVSRRTPVIASDPSNGVYTYADEAEAQSALQAALERREPNGSGAQLAQSHSWTAKVAAILTFVGGL
ncbi:glycosyltransferase family protein [Microbacterium aquilitoris]|uniref:glycosyltransferase family protein n=1 Tax=Microbacterium aquilitoris TaxID=3067307 RepID=UPI00288D2563|nr:glycosyltransferase [Microbacterium sp. KSW2-22]MDT3346308.1 glycosyltransferase [Microbacterium sp. KSW2-22]